MSILSAPIHSSGSKRVGHTLWIGWGRSEQVQPLHARQEVWRFPETKGRTSDLLRVPSLTDFRGLG